MDIRAPLYVASFEKVFTGEGRVILFRAPSHAFAEAVASDEKGTGELVTNLNLASFMEGVPVEYIHKSWAINVPRAERKSRYRKLSVRRNRD